MCLVTNVLRALLFFLPILPRRFILDEQILSIRKVLFHELAHNDFSDHDDNFYMLMRQVRYSARGEGKKSLSECWTPSHPCDLSLLSLLRRLSTGCGVNGNKAKGL